MTIFLTVLGLGAGAGIFLGAIVGSIAGWHPIEYLRFQLGSDKSDTWAEGELTGEQPVVVRTPGRHRVESVEARLGDGGERLDDTARMSRIEVA